MKIILASASPRRSELLSLMGIPFTVIPSHGEEIPIPSAPRETVEKLSRLKALDVAGELAEPYFVIGADTIVSLNGEILGKPEHTQHAVEMLTRLQGQTHQVYTGVTCVVHHETLNEIFTFSEMTEVKMYPMTQAEIIAYVATQEPMDKAGGYGIQGKAAVFIERINGDYHNVVGFPVSRFYHELTERNLQKILPASL